MEDEKMAAGVSALSQSLQNSTKLSVVYCMSSPLRLHKLSEESY
jgi:hypothetical protein